MAKFSLLPSFVCLEISAIEATKRLKDQPIGTFLLRRSSDPSAIYTLSIRIGPEANVLNVRIFARSSAGGLRYYVGLGKKKRKPEFHFDSVIELLRYYIEIGKQRENTTKNAGVSKFCSVLPELKPLVIN